MTTQPDRTRPPGPTTPPDQAEGPTAPAPDPVQRWVDLQIITGEQAAAIRADLAVHPGPSPLVPVTPPAGPRTPRGSLVAEALGYLGGAIIIVAVGLAAGRFWPDLSTLTRLSLAAGVAVVILLAGAAVPIVTPAGMRLRSVLWLVATALTAGFLALLSEEVLHLHEARQALFVAAGTALVAGVLWWRHHLLLQHLATAGCVVATVSAATALLPDSQMSWSACAWAVGVAWYLLGWAGVLRPRREAELIGAVVSGFLAAVFAAEPWGWPLALLTLVALAVAAVRMRDLPLLVIDAVATLNVLPAMVTRYFPGLLSAAAVLLGVGGLLVAAAVLALRRPRQPEAAAPAWSTGTPAEGWVAAVTVLAVTAAVVVLVALL